jgi:hypothetical protein
MRQRPEKDEDAELLEAEKETDGLAEGDGPFVFTESPACQTRYKAMHGEVYDTYRPFAFPAFSASSKSFAKSYLLGQTDLFKHFCDLKVGFMLTL